MAGTTKKAAAAADSSLRQQWIGATERTQALLDTAWMAALQAEQGAPSS